MDLDETWQVGLRPEKTKALHVSSEIALLVCALLTASSIPYSQTTWNSVAGFVCLYVRTVFQNASSPSFLVRLS